MGTTSMRHSPGRLGRWVGASALGFGVLESLVSVQLGVLLLLVVVCATAAAGITGTTRSADLLRVRGVTSRWAGILVVASGLLGMVGTYAGLGLIGVAWWLAVLLAAWFSAADTTPVGPATGVTGSPTGASGRTVPAGSPRSARDIHRPGDDQERLGSLSDSELCWAWRNSFFAAEHAAADPDRLDRISLTRRGYLDEMQRRDPRGFALWLDAGARAASNPSRYWKSDA